MRLAYVIVAFRSAAHLDDCLASIAADRIPDSEIVVVDNASPDDSAERARCHPAAPRVVVSPSNRGFGAGCGIGAGATKAELIWFVNPDAALVPGATARMVERMMRDPGLGAVGPRVIDPTGESRAVQAGHEPGLRSALGHFLLLGRLPGLERLFPPLHLASGNVATEPDWVSGAAMLVRHAAFDDVGGFDERLFLYMEDVDLCRRLREAGWRIAYEPDAEVRHAMGGSQASGQATRWYRAFHAYVRDRRGSGVARLASLVAALGLALRAAASRRSRPANARRMAEAAGVALRCAVGREQALGG